MQPLPKYLNQSIRWIAQAWQDLPLGFKGVFVIALPLTVLLSSLASLYLREQASTMLENKLKHALQNQRDIQTVHTQLLEASTGVRDYLLTGDKHFLNIFFQAQKMLPIIITNLDQQLETEQQKRRLAVIAPLVTKNLDDLKALASHEAAVASDDLIAQFKSQVETLDRLRKEIETLNAEEAILVAKDQKEILLQRQKNISATLIATIAGIIGSLVAVWIFSLTIVKRVRLLRDSADHLAHAEALNLPSSSRDELGQLSDALDQASQLLAKNISDALHARQEAEEANAAKSMFLSRTSHELRTPLNAILGFAQLLEQDLPEGKQRDSATLIQSAGKHLLKLINEVLEIARIEAGEMTLTLAPTDINHLIAEAVDYITPMANKRDIDIKTTITADLWAMANQQKLLQVILNLLSNALKYGPASATVELKAFQHEADVVIEVHDEGPGFPATMRERLFTPFDRLGAEHTKIEGIGLGLPLSKQFMLAMHGTIHVAEHRSLFWVTLPACGPSQSADSPLPPTPVHQPLRSNDKRTIFYVEDNISNRALVEAIIRRQSDLRLHTVTTLKDARLQFAEVSPALLLIDLNLPDGSGEMLIHEIKAQKAYQHLPIMVLSADALPETIQRLQAAGVDHYMTKPLDVALFVKKIRTLLPA